MLNLFAPPTGLLGDQEEAIRQQMQMQGLLGLAAGLFQAGAPSRTRQSLGGSALQGLMAGQQMAQGTMDQALKSMVLKQQMDEAQRKRTQDIAQRQALESFVSGLPESERAKFMAFPTQAAEAMFRPTKQSVQTIYTPEGKETKVVFNEATGEYTSIGGTKAESFVQVDRGNVIELRRPSGEVIGTVPKGAAPTAPSFSMTETGQILNTKTGQLLQPRDEKGNPIVFNQSVKASDGERNAAGFYMRMVDATSTMNEPLKDSSGNPITDKNGKPVTLSVVAEKPEFFAELAGGILPNWMGGRQAQNFITSQARQQYQQAQENWVTANLRKESGAVIAVDEMKQEIRKYFPQIGDSQGVIEQKTKARKVVEEAMRRNAGRAISVAPQQRNIEVNY